MAGTWSKLKKSLSLKPSHRSSNSTSPPQLPSPMTASSISDGSPIYSRSYGSRSSSSSITRISKSFSIRSSKRTCAICLGNVKTGQGQAILIAECSHSFHFNCIASSVKHGNHLCPICRSKWKEMPFQFPASNGEPQHVGAGRARVSPFQGPPDDYHVNVPRTLPPPSSLWPEPNHFYDDEPLPSVSADPTSNSLPTRSHSITFKAFLEQPAVAASDSISSFAVLVNVRAPPLPDDVHERAPIDLVTVLDVSASMAGLKLSLLKRAVLFVIQNLGHSDRLSIVAFSSTAQRIFPLRRMSDRGREDATLAINSLSLDGGTNIMEGLKKGARVLEERRERNPVASIILLSDGRDTCNQYSSQHQNSQNSNAWQIGGYLNTLPASICLSNREVTDEAPPPTIPVHTFGFGSDHDSASMHAISNASGGTFSFIESVSIVQDAFARCMGGLLSVVAQEVRLTVRSVSPGVQIQFIPSGRYLNNIFEQGQRGVVDAGDLYADEEREFLVYLSVPVISVAEGEEREGKTSLLDVLCSFRGMVLKEMVQVEGERVEIRRPEVLSPPDMIVSLEVDRQKNRLWVADGIAEAQELAEAGNLEGAQAVLTNRRATLLSSASAQAGDELCIWLEAELTAIGERMATVELYEHTGRAYVLSGLSSHAGQRATTRGDLTTQSMVLSRDGGNYREQTGAVGYDTPSMLNMVSKSQNLSLASEFIELTRLAAQHPRCEQP